MKKRWVLVVSFLAMFCASCAEEKQNYQFPLQPKSTGVAEFPVRDILGSETLDGVLRSTNGNFQRASEILSPRVERGDVDAEEALAQLILTWASNPKRHGPNPYRVEYAWDLYRDVAIKRPNSAGWLGDRYMHGDIGLEKNEDIGRCLLDDAPRVPPKICLQK